MYKLAERFTSDSSSPVQLNFEFSGDRRACKTFLNSFYSQSPGKRKEDDYLTLHEHLLTQALILTNSCEPGLLTLRVSPGGHIKVSQAGWLETRDLSSHCSGGRMSQTEVSAGHASIEGSGCPPASSGNGCRQLSSAPVGWWRRRPCLAVLLEAPVSSYGHRSYLTLYVYRNLHSTYLCKDTISI